jgi:hypothetical protein
MAPILGIWASAASAAATTSYESIASTSGTGSSGTITFSSIPSTYTHLQLRIIGRTAQSATSAYSYTQFNLDSGNNYTIHYLEGNGSSATATAFTPTAGNYVMNTTAASANSNVYSVGVIDILDYANTSKNKTVRSLSGFDNNGSGTVNLFSGLWINTNAISTITIVGSGNWTADSKFALYGIKG